ncbi:cell division control protein 6 [Apiospora marii]|uniref:cell division control protein 6 n=1 Tax=Apiospora marii TaxID=335849 RepID=UPI00312FE09A
MARSVLGKRTRSSREPEVELSTKRITRQTRSLLINDENSDPTTVTIAEDSQETEPAGVVEEITEESLARTPSSKEATCPPPTASTKARKVDRNPLTPSTPRFRDALAKAPVTPRHRVISDPGQLVGRDDERQQLRDFIARCSTAQPSGCIYVSGPPGTGKSAMVNEITQEVVKSRDVKKAYINCMSIKSSKDLYATLLDLLCDKTDAAEVDAAATLQKLFMPRKKTSDVYLIVLDEIDHILTLDLESLYRVFEWSMGKSSRLMLVGIANALDLTDRFLPRLKSRNLKPELLPFLPYTALQIKTIITARLKSLVPEGAPLPFIHPAAIELCSRKVSSQTGDLRKAFEICRRAIDLVEMETKQKHDAEIREKTLLASPSRKVLGENINLSSPSRGTSHKGHAETLLASLKELSVETAPRVTIAHLNKITAAAFSNGTSQRLKTLNLQQKAALCSLLVLEKRNRASKASSILSTPSKQHVTAPSIKTLYDAYCLLCTQDSVLHPLSSSEFREVMSSLETLSLVSAVDGKTGSFIGSQTPSKRGEEGRIRCQCRAC